MPNRKTEANNANSTRGKGRMNETERRGEKFIVTTLRERRLTMIAKDLVPESAKDLVPRKANKSDQRVTKNSVPVVAKIETLNIGNYLHLMREQLSKECQSYVTALNKDITDDLATTAIMIQVLDAIKVCYDHI